MSMNVQQVVLVKMAGSARIQEEDISAPALEDGSLERIVIKVEY